MDEVFTVKLDQGVVGKYISPKIARVCDEVYGKRFKEYGLHLKHKTLTPEKVEIDVSIYNRHDVKKSGRFTFSPYDEYFDESDFLTHLNTSIVKFVRSL